MDDPFLIALLLLTLVNLVFLVLIFRARREGEAEEEGAAARLLREESRAARQENADAARALREEVSQQITALGRQQSERLEKLEATLESRMKALQEGNEKRLEQMRATVDEKLQSTLEKRLGESFKQVSERLEAVHKGLGEMQELASGVGELKRVLTNVKSRGVWGEVQLGSLLEDILTPEQYEANFKPDLGSDRHVEYAVRFPGGAEGGPSWLPIDSKFPQEDYRRLLDASDAADAEGVVAARKALVKAVELAAKDIAGKYIKPPRTLDYAILFLPTESLYADVLRESGIQERIQSNYRVSLAGPTTLAALLTSFRMGFKALALKERSTEVWDILAAVKTEFESFDKVMAKVRDQLRRASDTIEEDVARRTRVMRRKLKDVEQLPSEDTARLLGDLEADPEDER